MINESEEGEGETGGGGLPGEGPGDLLDQPGVIQVSPQDKEAIERVGESRPVRARGFFIIFIILAESSGVS